MIKWTSIGTATDIDGKFNLEVPQSDTTKLIFSFVGMQNYELKISKKKTEYNVVMKSDTKALDESRNNYLMCVVYTTNAEEHQYLDSYISSSQIGSKSWSSVVIVKRDKGNGLNISTRNINYCTVGMYKNALTTAGITDADIIVAGPQEISGTAALVGVFKAYQEMTGETINADIIDASLNELVVTGQLEQSIAGLSDEEVEEFIAYIKSVIAQNDLKDEASINQAIDDACSKYNVTLSDSERQQIVDLLLKITSLGINLDSLVDYAESLYHSFKDGGGDSSVLSSVGTFFSNVFSSIADFFKGLFS